MYTLSIPPTGKLFVPHAPVILVVSDGDKIIEVGARPEPTGTSPTRHPTSHEYGK